MRKITFVYVCACIDIGFFADEIDVNQNRLLWAVLDDLEDVAADDFSKFLWVFYNPCVSC